jgi:hypothetical protein
MTKLNILTRRAALAASVVALVAMAAAVPLKTALADNDNWQRQHDWQHSDNRDHNWGDHDNRYGDQRPGYYYAQPQPYYYQPSPGYYAPQPGVNLQLNIQ